MLGRRLRSFSTSLLRNRHWQEIMANPVSSPQDSAFADRRVYPRVSVALPAFLQADGERHSAKLLDLSSGGAKLSCTASLSIGASVILDCGTLCCAAVVRWKNGAFLGICFDGVLDGREVFALIERSRTLQAWMKAKD
jgi:hypothetical protein